MIDSEVEFRRTALGLVLFLLVMCTLFALVPQALAGGPPQQMVLQGSLYEQARALVTDNVLTVTAISVLAGAGGILFGYYRLPFYSKEHPQWRMLFRLEVAAVASIFSAILLFAFFDGNWSARLVALAVLAPINGMAAPPFYDWIWRPALWPALKAIWPVKGRV